MRVDVDPGNEDAVDALEVSQVLASLCSAPDCVTSSRVLIMCEDQRDIQCHARGRQFFERRYACFGGGNLDHAVGMSGAPLPAKFDVFFCAIGVRDSERRIFQQWVKFEGNPASIASGLLMN